ncbi:hypothetical protein DVH05_003084 [Phytophthora capsici]|nr:hypothetical protein DVH05_003084 [Phytophthora capsici]
MVNQQGRSHRPSPRASRGQGQVSISTAGSVTIWLPTAPPPDSKPLMTLCWASLTDDGTVSTVLTDVVTLLPPPDAMQPGEPPSHSLFAPSSSSKRPATRSASKLSPPPKKRRTKPSYTLELPDNTPKRVRSDVEALLKKVDATGKAPYRLAYPWDGERAGYDPAKYPDLHLQHYRF